MQNLRAIRKARKMTQEDIALLVGVSASAISQYENGKKNPSFETALKIAEALDCESSDLVTSRTGMIDAIERDNKKTATNGDGISSDAMKLANNREELKRLVDRLTDQEVSDYLSDFRKTILGQ